MSELIQKPPVRRNSRVNVMQITVVHDLDAKTIACTGTTPYITDPQDGALVQCRNLLVRYFEEITAPPTKDKASPVWGEWAEEPGEEPAPEIRTPDPEKKLKLVK